MLPKPPKKAHQLATNLQQRGVRWIPERGKWLARLADLDGKQVSRLFDEEREARDWHSEQKAKVLLCRRAQRRGEIISERVLGASARPAAHTDEIVSDYLSDQQARNRKPSHLMRISHILGAMAKAVPNLASSAAAEDIERWVNNLRTGSAERQRPVSAGTRNKWVLTARALCKWAAKRKRITVDPMTCIELSSVPDFLKPQFTVDELRTMMGKSHYKITRDRQPKRDPWHLLAAVMVYAGLRADEAANLRWQDIEWNSRFIMIRLESGAKIKRDRERIVPLQEELAALLLPVKQTDGRLFQGKGLNLRRGLRGFLRRCNIDPGKRSPHSCRHTYGGLMTATGVPSLLLSAYMGHSNLETTAGYTKLAMRYVVSAHGWKMGQFQLLPTFTAR